MTTFEYIIIILAFAVAALMSFLCSPLAQKVAAKIGAIDVPKDNRRMHKKPIPRLGGLAIFLGFFISTLVFTIDFIDIEIYGILMGGMVIVALGMADDVLALKASRKFVVQLIAIALPVVCGARIEQFPNFFGDTAYVTLPAFWSYAVSFIWLLAILNAVNIIDGLDGLACGVSSIMTISSLAILILLEAAQASVLAAALAGACIGFLPYNFNPAKMFMGDTGSMFIGYSLACLSIVGIFKASGLVTFFVPIILYLLPIFDLLFAAVRRILSGKSPTQGDKSHLHHKLIAVGLSQKKAVVLLYGVSALLGLCAALLAVDDFTKTMIIIGAFFIVAMLVAYFFYRKEDKLEKGENEE